MTNHNSSTPRSLAQLLTLRYQWESIVSDYKLSDHNGTISNLVWFTKYGNRSNRFRPGFDTAMKIAKTIIEEVNNYEAFDISSLRR